MYFLLYMTCTATTCSHSDNPRRSPNSSRAVSVRPELSHTERAYCGHGKPHALFAECCAHGAPIHFTHRPPLIRHRCAPFRLPCPVQAFSRLFRTPQPPLPAALVVYCRVPRLCRARRSPPPPCASRFFAPCTTVCGSATRAATTPPRRRLQKRSRRRLSRSSDTANRWWYIW